MKKICILGSFSGKNKGDDIILAGIVKSFTKLYKTPQLYLITKRPNYFKNFDSRVIPIKSRISLFSFNTFKYCAKSDLLLITQSNLFSYKLFNLFYNRVLIYFIIVQLNKIFFRKKIILFFAGIGPIKSRFSEFLVKKIVKSADYIILRERKSKEYLKKWEIAEYHVAADIALSVDVKNKNWLSVKKLKTSSKNKTVIGVNISKYTGQFSNQSTSRNKLFESFEKAYKSSYYYVFMPSCQDDIRITHELISYLKLKQNQYQIAEDISYQEYVSLQTNCDYFIGTRMHSLIMSLISQTPFIGINYHPKVKDFMEIAGVPEYLIDFGNLDLNEKIKQISMHSSKVKKQLHFSITKHRKCINKELERFYCEICEK